MLVERRQRAAQESMSSSGRTDTTAILDIDGTLVDTNYQHTISWARALAAHDIAVPLWRIHRHIGMGGDQVIEALCGREVEERAGDAIREAEGERYMELIDEVRPMAGARKLIQALKARGHRVVLASSAKPEEVDRYLDMLDARELADGWTTSADVERTKPAPDLVHAALHRIDGDADSAVMIGDTPWDVRSAGEAGVDTIAVITGGFSEQELREAGAVAVFESVADLCEQLDTTTL
jgi:HAD superfamily hydrolase (TIGR01509 family)